MFQAFILGLVQGLGEFLPISSSAHLIVAPWLFGWQDQGLAFDVALHWATLLAVVSYFRKDLYHIIKGFWHSLFKSTRNIANNVYQKLAWLLIVGTVPAAVIGKFLQPLVEHSFRSPLIPVITMAVFGGILFLADKLGRKNADLDHVSKWQGFVVGLSQALAFVPGVSRSGASITAGLFLGLKREAAAKFSFLLAIPITFGAGILELPDIGRIENMSHLALGFATAFVAAFLSIKYLLKYICRADYSIFVWYRWVFAVVVLVFYFAK